MVLRRRKKDERREERERDGRNETPDSPNGVPPKTPPDVPAPDRVSNPGTLAGLRGNVRTLRPNSRTPYGIPWSNVSRWEPAFTNAGGEFEVDPLLMAAMAVVESDANHFKPGTPWVIDRDDGFGDGLSVGIMQVKPLVWQDLVPNANAYTPEGNIRLGTAIMAYAIGKHGTWQKALTTVYFPTTDPNGTTPQHYVATVTSLMAEMREQVGESPNPPSSTPEVPSQPTKLDPIAVIVGGRKYTAEYGFKSSAAGPFYAYFHGHGGSSDLHTGIDVPGTRGEKLYTPAAGIVTCAGTGNGPGSWQTGCAAFADQDGGGAGRVEVMLDSGVSMIFGHCAKALVKVGQRVKAGDAIATMGGMLGTHLHLECRSPGPNVYTIIDPIPALKEAMGGKPVPAPIDAIPYKWDAPDRNLFVVTIDRAKTARQRADPAAKRLYDLKALDDFEAVGIVPGNDKKPWWLLTDNARVPWDESDIDVVKVG